AVLPVGEVLDVGDAGEPLGLRHLGGDGGDDLWSPMARAVAVYAGCAAVGVVLMLVLVVASGVGVVDLGTLYAWMCAGLPAVSLIAGWLILGRWGRPAVVAGTPPRYVPLGILICFALVPLAYCGYLVLFRSLR
ncbi:hypothetical protein AB0I76_21655, partial [Micromonospora sp. NPDC049799]